MRWRDKTRIFVGDFETTVYEGQTKTEVWASACVELKSEDVQVFNCIEDQWEYFLKQKCSLICYYHNLRFDGAFWLYFFEFVLHLKQATIQTGECWDFIDDKDMSNNTFKYMISDMGQWYSITVKHNNHVIQFRDSLKLLPFSVEKIGKSFKTKHQKLNIEYEGERHAHSIITDDEKAYIANDVLVVKEALEILYEQGHNRLTIGSCCLNEYKSLLLPVAWGNEREENYREMFPDLTQIPIDPEIYGSATADEYIRKGYHGGWCYVKKGCENIIYHKGCTADVNSLYPSMMHSDSGNRYPVGKPTFWKGDYIPDTVYDNNLYYFLRVRCRFYLKPGYLPFIQIKGSWLYRSNECLTTSDIPSLKTGKPQKYLVNADGALVPTDVILTMSMTDWELFKKHYDIVDPEILDGCYFKTKIGIFDEYINKYRQIKMTSTGAIRELAKLFLNNLYGKLAAGTNSSYKIAYPSDGIIKYASQFKNDKESGYIAAGAAITSYARAFTITAAQRNYDVFLYADTDSIHCCTTPDKLEGVPLDDNAFCHWKIESQWDEGLFVRQKTYVEHVTHDGEKLRETPEYNIRCAGMNKRAKDIFLRSMCWDESQRDADWFKAMPAREQESVSVKRQLSDFKIGLKLAGKLLPKTIPGGVILQATTYEMR